MKIHNRKGIKDMYDFENHLKKYFEIYEIHFAFKQKELFELLERRSHYITKQSHFKLSELNEKIQFHLKS